MAAFLFHSLTRSLTSSSQNLSFSLAHCLSQPVRVSLCAHVLHFSCYYACSCHSFNFIYIAPRFCCCAMCIHTGLLNQTFISTSFVHSFVRLARSFVRSFVSFFVSLVVVVAAAFLHLTSFWCLQVRTHLFNTLGRCSASLYITHTPFCNTFIFYFIYFTQKVHIELLRCRYIVESSPSS